MLFLSSAEIGKEYIVRKIQVDDDLKRRLEVLGLTVDTTVKVLNLKRGGAMIIKFRGTRFAIGRIIADSTIVRGVV